MAALDGVVVTGMIVPTDTADTYAVADAKYIKGVNYAVQTKAELEAITEARRTEGMEVYVVEEKIKYRLVEGEWEVVPDVGSIDLSEYVMLTQLEEKLQQEYVSKENLATEMETPLNEKLTEYTNTEELEKKLEGYVPKEQLSELDVYTKAEVDDLLANSTAGDMLYTSTVPTTVTIGGIQAGTTFDGVLISKILDDLFHPYQKPAFASFGVSTKTVEVGTAVTTNNYSWNISNSDNANLESLELTLDGQNLTIPNKTATGSNVAIANTSISKNVAATVTATIKCTNNKDEAFTANASISWKYKMYNGVSTKEVLTADDIKAMTSKLADNAKGTHSFTGSGYQYLVFPAAWGKPENIKDNKTGFGLAHVVLDNVSIESNGVTTEYMVIRSKEYLNTVVPLIVS